MLQIDYCLKQPFDESCLMSPLAENLFGLEYYLTRKHLVLSQVLIKK